MILLQRVKLVISRVSILVLVDVALRFSEISRACR